MIGLIISPKKQHIMKILVVTEFFPESADVEISGGVEARCYYIAREIAKKHDITILCSRETDSCKERIIDGIRVIPCGIPQRYRQTGGFIGRLKFMNEACKIGSSLDVDLVEGTNFITYLPTYKIAKNKGVPAIAWYNDVWIGKWIKHLGIISGLLGEVLERRILSKKWSHFIANSNYTYKNLLKRGISKKRVKVIPCGVDFEQIDVTSHIQNKFPTICAVSRLVSYKRIDTLIKAIPQIKKEIPDIRCRIIGSGPERQKLEKLVSELGLEQEVNFVGYVQKHSDVLREIASAHLFCHPSSVEGFGMVVMEAMACGTPYICSDIPALKEITNNGTGGIIFKEENPDNLAKNVIRLLKDRTLYDKCATNGREHAEKYNWKKIAETTEELYNKILT